MWAQHQATDGTYTFEDLMIAHEILNTKDENEAAYKRWLEGLE
jgi:hypothetical protein